MLLILLNSAGIISILICSQRYDWKAKEDILVRFFARDSIYAKRAYAIAIPSVCPSVRHTGDSCKNGWS